MGPKYFENNFTLILDRTVTKILTKIFPINELILFEFLFSSKFIYRSVRQSYMYNKYSRGAHDSYL